MNNGPVKFDSNTERKAYWELIHSQYTASQLQEAMRTLKPDAQRVLDLHYNQQYSLQEITVLVNRSISVVRNHHNRGIYKLYRYFNPRPDSTIE
jgi:DNA-directed RNA polymerase specialized sigma24 family protein